MSCSVHSPGSFNLSHYITRLIRQDTLKFIHVLYEQSHKQGGYGLIEEVGGSEAARSQSCIGVCASMLKRNERVAGKPEKIEGVQTKTGKGLKNWPPFC